MRTGLFDAVYCSIALNQKTGFSKTGILFILFLIHKKVGNREERG
jgi:hypothetical protein